MDGLEERFRVNGRDALADALAEKRAALAETPSRWHPELLFLLLELSDQPLFNSKLSDLESLRPRLDEAEPTLRWEEIAEEDGWDEDAAIWRSIKYTDSSDDEVYEDDLKSESEVSSVSSASPVGRTASDLIIHPEDIKQLNLIRNAQEWRSDALPTDATGHARKIPVTEFHILREVLFMLQGFDTTLFDSKGSVNPAFQMAHLAWETHKALIGHFSEAGRQLSILRKFVALSQTSSHLQVFRDSVASRLRDFDLTVSEIERGLVAPKDHIVVSLLSIKGRLAPSLEPLACLSSIVAQMLAKSKSGDFLFLELLFDEASLAQLAGKLPVYEFLTRIFVECFHVYLRPIRLWMDEGRLLPDDKIFFVSESPTQVAPSKIWQDQFRLRQATDGTLHAPKFLRPAANKIFNAGKKIVVLKRLGRFTPSASLAEDREPALDYETICTEGFELAPFPELFDAAFDRWIQSKYSSTSLTLRNILFSECGLWKALDALQYLYFMSEGAATEAFTNNLFSKLDALIPTWNNRYALTNVAQEAFSALLDPTRLSINVAPDGLRLSAPHTRDSVRTALPTVTVTYRLAWPIQMILSEESLSHYQSIYTLLLQVRRALYALHRQKMLENYWTDDENWEERATYYSIRANLLWFCNVIQTYFATLVLAPNSAKMKQDMAAAHDVDAMISIHSAFLKRVIDEACLGSRLTPIRESVLDMFDLAIKLEQSTRAKSQKEGEDSRISTSSTPQAGRPTAKGAKYVEDSDEEASGDEARDEEQSTIQLDKPYATLLREIKADFDKRLRFVREGLRSVARASGDAQSAKWDMLAEMLQTGNRYER